MSLFSRILGKSPPARAPELYLGAFGKHPGWNDHIDDINLVTQRLVDLKSLLYIEGISSCIDAGKWDKLEPTQQLDGFQHDLLMRTRGELLVGRLWSSSDGKGRTRYPMVVVVHLCGVALEPAVAAIVPELDQIQARCQSVQTAQEVTAILNASQDALRAKLLRSEAGQPELTIGPGFLATLAEQPEWGPNHQGLHRMLYQLQRELPDFVSGVQPGTRSLRTTDEARTHHLRLPAAPGMPSSEILMTGVRLLLTKLDPSVPMLLITPRHAPFVDAIVGEPVGSQLFCLRAGEKAIPLVTEIPYTLDGSFIAECEGFIRQQAGSPKEIAAATSASSRKPAGRFRALLWSTVLAAAAGSYDGLGNTALASPEPVAPSRQVDSSPEPRELFNLALLSFQRALNTPDLTDAQAASAARSFTQRVRSLPGGIAFLGPVAELLLAVDAAVDGGAAPLVDDESLKLGPAATGVYLGQQDGRLVKFVPQDKADVPTLKFARVDIPAEGQREAYGVYISTTEVSIDMASRLVGGIGGAQGAADLRRVLMSFDALSDTRRGPRTWNWSKIDTYPLAPAPFWFPVADIRDEQARKLMVSLSAPTGASPLQHVSPTAALLIARMAGCRLPTTAEWAAANAAWPTQPPALPNLRDEAIESHLAALGSAAAAIDSGTFVQHPKPTQAVPADGIVYFAPVDAATGSVPAVRDLVGNVAEMTLDVSPQNQPEPRVAAVSAFALEHAKSWKVVGGSALAHGDPMKSESLILAEAEEGYSDVGFRLAFTAGRASAQSIAGRLRKLIDPLPTLPVR